MRWRLNHQDSLFLADTFRSGSPDRERVASVIAGDEALLERMLDDDQLFQRLVTDEESLVLVSPWLFFTVLLRRARRDLPGEPFTIERRSQQRVVLFDVDQVSKLLESEGVRDYLAAMLASFTRIHSVTVPVRVQKGVWRKYRTNDLDVESLMRYAGGLEESARYEPYRRIADVCLFLAGMFPNYIEARHRYPHSRQVRLGARGRVIDSLEDFEKHGRAFYRLAAGHQRARAEGLVDVLGTLSDDFLLAEKPLAFLANHYLRFSKHRLFAEP